MAKTTYEPKLFVVTCDPSDAALRPNSFCTSESWEGDKTAQSWTPIAASILH